MMLGGTGRRRAMPWELYRMVPRPDAQSMVVEYWVLSYRWHITLLDAELQGMLDGSTFECLNTVRLLRRCGTRHPMPGRDAEWHQVRLLGYVTYDTVPGKRCRMAPWSDAWSMMLQCGCAMPRYAVGGRCTSFAVERNCGWHYA